MSRLSMNERNLLVEIEYNLRKAADGGAGAAEGSGGGGDASAANQQTQITAEQAIQAAVQIIDDWDESDRAKVNPIAGQAGVAAGAGGTSANTQRIVHSSDDPVVISLEVIEDWNEATRAKVNPIAGQAGVQGGAGAVTALTQRVAFATDANAIDGEVADDAAETGSPVLVGGSAQNPDSLPAAVSANDRAKFVTDLSRRIITYLGTTLDETNDKVRAVTEGYKTTYSASFAGLAPAALATDILEIVGSATKTVRVTRVQITGVATAAGAYNVVLVKRSTAATGGTSSSATVVPHDSNDAAGTAVIKGYTANPTIGTIVGAIRSQRITVSTGAGAIPIVPVSFEFGVRNARAVVLRGVAQTLCLNLAGVTMTGGLLDIDVEWTEE